MTSRVMIARLMGHPEIAVRTTGRSFPGDTPRWFADITKIRRLGFEPAVDLESGLAATIAWLLAQPVPAVV